MTVLRQRMTTPGLSLTLPASGRAAATQTRRQDGELISLPRKGWKRHSGRLLELPFCVPSKTSAITES